MELQLQNFDLKQISESGWRHGRSLPRKPSVLTAAGRHLTGTGTGILTWTGITGPALI